MAEQDKPTTDENVPCEICLKEIPVSEAEVDDAADYVRYFCGLDCYAKWKDQKHKHKEKQGE
jgi:hypothetical protein